MNPENYAEIVESYNETQEVEEKTKKKLFKKIKSSDDLQDYMDSLIPEDEDYSQER